MPTFVLRNLKSTNMDFKTELQNLVNRYAGIIKKVKVEFVKDVEVEPNNQPIQYALSSQPPVQMPTTTPGGFAGSAPTLHAQADGTAIRGAAPLPANIAAAQGSAMSAVAAAAAAAKARAAQPTPTL